MSYIKTKGIVIKEVNTGEADKFITLFTKYAGKITAFSKGSRRPKSRLIAGTQFLCYSDFVLFKGHDSYSVSSSDVIEPFYEIRNDVVKLTYSAHMVDIINDIIQENQPAVKILRLFLNSLHMLTKSDKSPELITRIFELRFLSLLGYAPYVKGCMTCGKEELNDMSFSFKMCGLICKNCTISDNYAMSVSSGTAKALNHIIHSNINDLFNFTVSTDVLNELSRISRRYLRERLEKDYTKLDFLKSLEL